MEDSKLIFGFERFCKRRQMPLNFKCSMRHDDLYAFIEFSTSFVEIYKSSDEFIRIKLLGFLKKGLDQGKLLSFQHEIQTYVHLTRNGFTVQYEDGRDDKNYEFSAGKEGQDFAVECKSISRYAGSAIIEEACFDFFKKIDWVKINNKINGLGIVCFSFDGKLTMGGHLCKNKYSPDTLLSEFYQKLESNHPDIVIKELESQSKYDFTWLNKTYSEIINDFPLSMVLCSLPDDFKQYLPSNFFVLHPKSPSEYINAIRKQIDKALEQIEGNLPAAIFLYLEGLTRSLLPKIRENISSIVLEKILYINQPVLVCVRTEFDYDRNESCYRSQMLTLYNDEFTPYQKYFENSVQT